MNGQYIKNQTKTIKRQEEKDKLYPVYISFIILLFVLRLGSRDRTALVWNFSNFLDSTSEESDIPSVSVLYGHKVFTMFRKIRNLQE